MPICTILLLEVTSPIAETELARARVELIADLGLEPDDFYIEGPLRVVRSRNEGPMPPSGDAAHAWLNVNVWHAFYSPTHLRGDVETIARCAEWLERRYPEGRLWYGNDEDDASIGPFPAERRRELLDHARDAENRARG